MPLPLISQNRGICGGILSNFGDKINAMLSEWKIFDIVDIWVKLRSLSWVQRRAFQPGKELIQLDTSATRGEVGSSVYLIAGKERRGRCSWPA